MESIVHDRGEALKLCESVEDDLRSSADSNTMTTDANDRSMEDAEENNRIIDKQLELDQDGLLMEAHQRIDVMLSSHLLATSNPVQRG